MQIEATSDDLRYAEYTRLFSPLISVLISCRLFVNVYDNRTMQSNLALLRALVWVCDCSHKLQNNKRVHQPLPVEGGEVVGAPPMSFFSEMAAEPLGGPR